MTFHLIHLKCGYIIFISIWVAEWPHFGKIGAHSVDNMFFVFLLFVILVISRFGFEGWILVLIASVPDLCMLFTSVLFAFTSIY